VSDREENERTEKRQIHEREERNMKMMVSLEEPVLKVAGQLMLLIPMDCGGSELAESSQGIAEIHGEFLKIVIPEWLAGVLRIAEGDLVCVHNSDGEFHIQRSKLVAVN
jgi:hypothetical protein